MSNIYKGEFQDYEGNVVYPHTTADVVFTTDGQTIQKKMNEQGIDYDSIKAQLTAGEHEFRFGVTADGEFGYHKEVEGADTVIPFSGKSPDEMYVHIGGGYNQFMLVLKPKERDIINTSYASCDTEYFMINYVSNQATSYIKAKKAGKYLVRENLSDKSKETVTTKICEVGDLIYSGHIGSTSVLICPA